MTESHIEKPEKYIGEIFLGSSYMKFYPIWWRNGFGQTDEAAIICSSFGEHKNNKKAETQEVHEQEIQEKDEKDLDRAEHHVELHGKQKNSNKNSLKVPIAAN